jgi:hypothetical protein
MRQRLASTPHEQRSILPKKTLGGVLAVPGGLATASKINRNGSFGRT